VNIHVDRTRGWTGGVAPVTWVTAWSEWCASSKVYSQTSQEEILRLFIASYVVWSRNCSVLAMPPTTVRKWIFSGLSANFNDRISRSFSRRRHRLKRSRMVDISSDCLSLGGTTVTLWISRCDAFDPIIFVGHINFCQMMLTMFDHVAD